MRHASVVKTNPTAQEREGKRWFLGIAKTIGTMLVVLWAIEIVNFLVGHRLNHWGILPRRLEGLPGIVFAPLLHGSFGHLAANSTLLALFGAMIAMRSRRELVFVTIGGAVLGGLGTWLFGSLFRPLGMHVGASGVVFAYFGYLLAIGLYERRIGSVIVSVLMAVGFGGLIYGVMPGQEGISWEGHLFGFLGGIFLARTVGRRTRPETPKRKRARA
ncbi:MAG: rhomboid family intramembrane serine protease [Myxococcales bacterium]|nr:rhomboid family intramembrane serine protease [Myxococcales bacterium]